jgi:hypothetical protein
VRDLHIQSERAPFRVPSSADAGSVAHARLRAMGTLRFSWFPVVLTLANSCGVEEGNYDFAATGGLSSSGSGGATGGSSGRTSQGGSEQTANGGEAGVESNSSGGASDAPMSTDGGMPGNGGQSAEVEGGADGGGSGGAAGAGSQDGQAPGGVGGAGSESGGAPASGGAETGAAGGEAGSSGGEPGQAPQPFACGDPLPSVTFPTVLTSTGTPPVAAGGELTPGLYILTQVVFYGTYSSVPGDVLELRPGYFHRRHTTYSSTGSALTGYEEIGTYATTGQAMARDVVACGLGSAPGLWTFTATADEIQLFWTEGSTKRVDIFELQP